MTAPDLDALIAELRRNAAAHFSYAENTLYTNAADALDGLRADVEKWRASFQDVSGRLVAAQAQQQAVRALAEGQRIVGSWAILAALDTGSTRDV